jgi:putative spermidine/putrescine transport system ATP-binding protein
MSAPQTLISFTGVEKTYDGKNLVVRDLNLNIRQGEFLSLLGPSGSGKTTTLMMLAGFESPTAGEISLKGVPITRTPPHKRNFGMVFQDYALFPHMTVADNIAYPLTVRKVSASDQATKVKRALDMVQLGAMGDRYPGQLSGGQRQRVALARALVFDPQLVLMDEPLGALDKQLREHMQIELKELHRRLGVTFVYVTHDQSEALTMSNRIAVFNDGIVQQLSTPAELYERPVNSFVAQFIGENNKLKGTVADIDSDNVASVKLETGEVVKALAIGPREKGGRTLLSIRPERVEINPNAQTADVILPGRIAELIYLGDHIRARLEVAGDNNFIVKVPNKGAANDVAEGREVKVGWKAADCRALDYAEFRH